MKEYQELKKRFLKGWNTWNNRSMTSHVLLPEALGLTLGVKEYENGWFKDSFLVDEKEKGTAIPRAHAYDASYICVEAEWRMVRFTLETSTDGENLYMLVTPDYTYTRRPATLILRGENLWNHGNLIRKVGEHLECTTESGKEIPVYSTGKEVFETLVDCTSPYLSVELWGEVGFSTGKELSLDEIRAKIESGKKKWEENKKKHGEKAELYNAMQTCLAWDTIYNPQDDTAFSTVSRNWNIGWGGYVLFCWDTYFAAAMAGVDNKDLAYLNAIEITLRHTPNGFVPNFAIGIHADSFDRSQPPVGSRTVLDLYKRYQEPWLVEFLYPMLKTWNQWFYDHRQTESGLFAWGSDPYNEPTGKKATWFDVANLQAAKYESGLDNAPMYDDVSYDEKTHLMHYEDIGLIALLIEDARSLAALAEILGKEEDKAFYEKRCRSLEEKMETVWDEEDGMYCSRNTDTGEFCHRYSPTNFYALFSSLVTPERAKRMMEEHFYNPDEFWGEYILPSIVRRDSAFPDQSYWRGRIWAPMNFLVYQAMERAGLQKEMSVMAEKSEALIMKEWIERGHVHENYCPDTGMGCGKENSDKYYHWGALLALIGILYREQK